MKTLLYVRWQQLRRLFRRSVLRSNRNYWIAFLLFIVLVVMLARKNLHFYLVVPAIVSLFIHFTRKDESLIRKAGLNARLVMFIEYLLISAPFILTCILHQLFGSILLLLAFLSVITLLHKEFEFHRNQ